jgi:predicted DCC family thiol-disulfide oxidoreductase YuxK
METDDPPPPLASLVSPDTAVILEGSGWMNTATAGAAFEIFFDGQCPLCIREIGLLRSLDHRRRLRFTDIAAKHFDPAFLGVDATVLMSRIHGRLWDGTLVEGVEVFRQAYAAVGFRWLVALTRLPAVSPFLDAMYGWFARNRLRLTGRCTDASCTPR